LEADMCDLLHRAEQIVEARNVEKQVQGRIPRTYVGFDRWRRMTHDERSRVVLDLNMDDAPHYRKWNGLDEAEQYHGEKEEMDL